MAAAVKVTAVIPVYNCEKYIGEALESALAQTYPLHEILVVDDGSTDGTREALRPYWDSIVYVYQKNAGEAAARNTGIRRASGEYIAFLDADDAWLAEKLRLQIEYFEAHPEIGLVYTDMTTFDDAGVLDKSVRISRRRTFHSGKIFPFLFREVLFCPSSVVFRKTCAEKVGGFDESFLIGCDYEMWLRMARRFEFGYVDRPLVMYRQHANMSSRKMGQIPQNGVPWQAKVLNRTLELYPEVRRELGESEVNRRLALPYMWLGRTWMDRGNHVEARKLIERAAQLSPWNLRYRLAYFATFLSPSQVSNATRLYRKFRRDTKTKAEADKTSEPAF